MAVIFIGAYASAYVVGGGPRIAYAGFQMAFAFFLCVVQGSAPAFDLTIARDRVIGILLGNIVVYLMFTNLWPVSVSKRIDPAIAAVLRRLKAMLTATTPSERRALAGETQSALAAIETDLDLAQYEPVNVRPSSNWFAARREAVDGIGSIMSPMLVIADQHTVVSGHFANRLDCIAGAIITPQVALSPPPPPAKLTQTGWTVFPLFAIIDCGLSGLQNTFSQNVGFGRLRIWGGKSR